MKIIKHQHHRLCRVSYVINQIIECAGDVEPRGRVDDSPGSPSETRASILNRLHDVSQQCDRAATLHTQGQPGDGNAFFLQEFPPLGQHRCLAETCRRGNECQLWWAS